MMNNYLFFKVSISDRNYINNINYLYMSNFKISTNNGTIDLFSVIATNTSTSNTTALTIPGYNNISFREVSSSRGHFVDCCSNTNNKYNVLVNGIKKDIFNEYKVAAKRIFRNQYQFIQQYSTGVLEFGYIETIIDFTTSEYNMYTHFRVALWGGGAAGDFGFYYSSSFKSPGGGGGGGAFILTNKLSTSNVVSIKIRTAYPKRLSDGISSTLNISYTNTPPATLYCPGGIMGSGTGGNAQGGAGGTYNSNAHNQNNIPLTEIKNGVDGDGIYGKENGYINSSYKNLSGIGDYQGNGKNGHYVTNNVASIAYSSPGAAIVYFYVE